jgi:DNA-binding MarR family transcriptional regulator
MNRQEGAMPMPAAIDPQSFCNNAMLRKAARRLGKLYDDALAPTGLRGTQFILLTQIGALDSPSMAELANSLLMDLSATRHSLGPLIRERLVRVKVDINDRRIKRVTLTATGVAKYAEAGKLWRQAQDRFETAFGAARAANLRQELGAVTSDAFEAAFSGKP